MREKADAAGLEHGQQKIGDEFRLRRHAGIVAADVERRPVVRLMAAHRQPVAVELLKRRGDLRVGADMTITGVAAARRLDNLDAVRTRDRPAQHDAGAIDDLARLFGAFSQSPTASSTSFLSPFSASQPCNRAQACGISVTGPACRTVWRRIGAISTMSTCMGFLCFPVSLLELAPLRALC